jgi:hypothetical protein
MSLVTSTNGTAANITIEEDAGNSQTDNLQVKLNASDPNNVEFDPDDEMTYWWTDTYTGTTPSQEEELFISERGSQFIDIDSTTASFNIAREVAEAQYFLKSTGAATGATTTVGPLAEGETASLSGGVTIKVSSITQTVGACTATGAECTVDQSGLSAVLSTGGSQVDAITRFPVDGTFVMSDATTPTAAIVISVGGPDVNDVTKSALAGSAVQFTAGMQITQAYGNTIVIAGTTGADTAAAGDDFIQALKAQA